MWKHQCPWHSEYESMEPSKCRRPWGASVICVGVVINLTNELDMKLQGIEDCKSNSRTMSKDGGVDTGLK
jgi:hypothetical protein